MIEYSVEASVAGFLITYPEHVPEVRSLIKTEDFQHINIRSVVSDIFRRYDRQEPIDGILLSETSNMSLADISDIAVNRAQTIGSCRSYIRAMKDHGLRSEIHNEVASFIEKVGDKSYNLEDITVDLISVLLDKTKTENDKKSIKHVREYCKDAADELHRRIELGGKTQGIETPFSGLNHRVGGFLPGDLITIAGRPGMAKTALVSNIALAASGKNNVLKYSLEMSGAALVDRYISSRGPTNLNNIKSGNMDDVDWNTYLRAVAEIKNLNLYISDDYSHNINTLRVSALKMKAKLGGVGLIIVDHIGIMQKSERTNSVREKICEITRELKNLAKELECPVIALSQLNRDCEKRPDKRPMLSDLKDSGSIEEDSDTVILCYRDKYYHENSEWGDIGELIVAKARNGLVGTEYVVWQGQHQRFVEASHVDIHRIKSSSSSSNNSQWDG